MSTNTPVRAVSAIAAAAPAALSGQGHRARLRAGRGLPAPVPVLVAGVAFGALALAAVAPSLVTGIDPNAGSAIDALQAPSGAHLLGTDQNGRDVFARMVHGAGPSLLIGVSASAIALAIGTLLGVLAAQGGRAPDRVISRLLDILLSIPGLVFTLVLIAALGPSTRTSIVGIAVAFAPGYARVVRGEVIRIRGSAYVEAAVALGWSRTQVALRHVVPNAVGPVLVLATIGVGAAIGMGSSLSFLGLGTQPPAAEWGSMLSSSRDYLAVAWWPAFFPGLAITVTVLSVTVIGHHLQRRPGAGR